MTIILQNLNKRQRALADQLWQMDSRAEVDEFVQSLPFAAQRDAKVVIDLLLWAQLDEFMETKLAEKVLDKYRL